jgi:hypothetical protein
LLGHCERHDCVEAIRERHGPDALEPRYEGAFVRR